jgi:Ca2+-binding RTX toxin-like protein
LILAFRPGEDRLDLRRLGVLSYEAAQAATSTAADGSAVITVGEHSIKLQSTKASLLSAGDFILDPLSVAATPNSLLLSETRVAENSAPGTVVASPIGGDPDPTAALTYTLLSDAGGRFAVAGRQLVVAGGLDYEASQAHQVLVRVTNEAGLSFDKLLDIGVVNLNEVSDTPSSPSGRSLIGTSGADTLVGSTGADTLSGGLGNDRLDGGAGNDRLDGGGGADVLIGGGGADSLIGGAGVDTAHYGAAAAGVGLDMLSPTWSGAYGEALGDSFSFVEWVEGSGYADVILATADANRLVGNAGNDWLDGRGGNDILLGGDGADTLIGGSGNDNLNGQAGNDVFDFSAGSGRDVVTGFAAGSGLGDVIQFHGQFTSFAQVLTAAHEVSNVTSPLGAAFTGTVITSGADEIWLANIKLAQLAANDFALV